MRAESFEVSLDEETLPIHDTCSVVQQQSSFTVRRAIAGSLCLVICLAIVMALSSEDSTIGGLRDRMSTATSELYFTTECLNALKNAKQAFDLQLISNAEYQTLKAQAFACNKGSAPSNPPPPPTPPPAPVPQHNPPPPPSNPLSQNAPVGSAVLKQGFDIFVKCNSDSPVGDNNCMKNPVLRFLKDSDRSSIQIKEGYYTDSIKGYSISGGLGCSGTSKFNSVEKTSLSSVTQATYRSQLNEDKSVVIRSNSVSKTHEISDTHSHTHSQSDTTFSLDAGKTLAFVGAVAAPFTGGLSSLGSFASLATTATESLGSVGSLTGALGGGLKALGASGGLTKVVNSLTNVGSKALSSTSLSSFVKKTVGDFAKPGGVGGQLWTEFTGLEKIPTNADGVLKAASALTKKATNGIIPRFPKDLSDAKSLASEVLSTHGTKIWKEYTGLDNAPFSASGVEKLKQELKTKAGSELSKLTGGKLTKIPTSLDEAAQFAKSAGAAYLKEYTGLDNVPTNPDELFKAGKRLAVATASHQVNKLTNGKIKRIPVSITDAENLAKQLGKDAFKQVTGMDFGKVEDWDSQKFVDMTSKIILGQIKSGTQTTGAALKGAHIDDLFGGSRRLLGGKSSTTTNSDTDSHTEKNSETQKEKATWTDVFGSSVKDSKLLSDATSQSTRGYSYTSTDTQYSQYYKMGLEQYDTNSDSFRNHFVSEMFDVRFASDVLDLVKKIRASPGCADDSARCWQFAGRLFADYGQTVIGTAVMGAKASTTVYYSDKSDEATRKRCSDELSQSDSWKTNAKHATSTGQAISGVDACKDSQNGGRSIAKTTTTKQKGIVPGCFGVPSSDNASPVPVKSTLLSISALPLGKIKGVGEGGYSLLMRAMNQWVEQAVLAIKKCGETTCNGHGKCWGEWTKMYVGTSTETSVITPKGCDCDPGFVGTNCKIAPTPSPTLHPTTRRPTSTPTRKPTPLPTYDWRCDTRFERFDQDWRYQDSGCDNKVNYKSYGVHYHHCSRKELCEVEGKNPGKAYIYKYGGPCSCYNSCCYAYDPSKFQSAERYNRV